MVALRSLDREPSPIPYRHAAGEREALLEEQARDRDARMDEWEAEDARLNCAASGGDVE